ncbi:Embryo defective protein [Quillaja saponaria]|uniref:Embryo defective protein n=1 Tax=Quillaja saponaria TaxID=32244 RepID=A0AAD7LR79_QUISA|nr:Embryo defective protein [Quillaja saponaria]
MEVLNLSTPNKCEIFAAIPSSCIKFPTSNWNKKIPSRPKVPISRFYRKNSLTVYLPLSNTRKFQIWAHFGRPTNRRNWLRKKLLEDQQVRINPIPSDPAFDFQHPSPSFNDSGIVGDNFSYDSVEESVSVKGVVGDDIADNNTVEKSKSKRLGESVLLNELENWVDQYKKDVEYWGIGSAPIFTVYQDSEGNVQKVAVNEDEILRRSQVERQELEGLTEVNSKILSAKSLARELESGNNVIPRNSSVAKFVVQGEKAGFVSAIRGFTHQPELFPKLSKAGSAILCVFVALWALKKLFAFGNEEAQYTELEKEMMRRKMKSRKEREVFKKGSVEVLVEPSEPPMISLEKPKLDKEKLMTSILKTKASSDKLVVQKSSSNATSMFLDMDNKIQEIRELAREAREVEGREHSVVCKDSEKNNPVIEESPNEIKVVKNNREESLSNLPDEDISQMMDANITTRMLSVDDTEIVDTEFLDKVASLDESNVQSCSSSSVIVSDDKKISMEETKHNGSTLHMKELGEDKQLSDAPSGNSSMKKKNSAKMKPRVIRSVSEARHYLQKKHHEQVPDQESLIETVKDNADDWRSPTGNSFGSHTSQISYANDILSRCTNSGGTSDPEPSIRACEDPDLQSKEPIKTKNSYSENFEIGFEVGYLQESQTTLSDEADGINMETGPSSMTENWMEKNFHEVEPIIKKIGAGFRDNYMVAKQKVNQQLDINTKMEPLESNEDDREFDWMKDNHLRDIVFQVRENELAGRDPFHLMGVEDKQAFLRGLEKNVEKENKNLTNLHEWLHSNIENLDYGADGISLYDPLEKIIPRWKGPPVENIPEFLNNFLEERQTISAGNNSNTYPVKKDVKPSVENTTESLSHENVNASLVDIDSKKKVLDENLKNSKTVIEGSDGSLRAGRKSGKEYWQHTKKWSSGFLESYNAETDPEVKSVMKDMGKDLDRWITEKEVEEAADLMTKIPDRNRRFMEKKLNKLKREMELFGPQAVVSKYREYADEKEEDYLWWLDLSHVLCIELYTVDNGEERVGFYSLEMATDLEVEPKPYHMIAFEDAGDCKDLCYIIQAHMDMLGNGHAFVVARPPKDAFREAKANGFSVTVIRKGELQLNIDQTLEEVEDQITEIGSKIYHDAIMRERSVDISSLTKGVFGFGGRPTKSKRSKRKLKKRSKR